MITRIEYTVEVTNSDKTTFTLIPVGLGSLEVAQARLRDLQTTPAEGDDEIGQTFRLVKRTVTITDWEPA